MTLHSVGPNCWPEALPSTHRSALAATCCSQSTPRSNQTSTGQHDLSSLTAAAQLPMQLCEPPLLKRTPCLLHATEAASPLHAMTFAHLHACRQRRHGKAASLSDPSRQALQPCSSSSSGRTGGMQTPACGSGVNRRRMRSPTRYPSDPWARWRVPATPSSSWQPLAWQVQSAAHGMCSM